MLACDDYQCHERQSWQELNLEREKAGLRPVTWDEYHNHGMHM
jgi:hypothetical protein